MAVYSLKRATPRMKFQHMKQVQEWKADLKDAQGTEAKRREAAETLAVCQEIRDRCTQVQYDQWWKSAPKGNAAFLKAAQRKLGRLKSNRPVRK